MTIIVLRYALGWIDAILMVILVVMSQDGWALARALIWYQSTVHVLYITAGGFLPYF